MSASGVFSTGLQSLFDTYSRQARLFPGLLVVFPPLLAVLAWFPWLIFSSVAASLLTISMSCGLLYALASYSRTKGKRVEARLVRQWGGWPSTLLLRHSSDLDPYTRERYHRFLAGALPEIDFPIESLEASHPKEADGVYASAVKWLIERTRNSREFPMLFRENIQYGFRRNLLGLKPLGIFLCSITLISSFLAILHEHPSFIHMISVLDLNNINLVLGQYGSSILSASVVNIISIPIWIFVVTKRWVKEAGFQYAHALLACCDRLAMTNEP